MIINSLQQAWSIKLDVYLKKKSPLIRMYSYIQIFCIPTNEDEGI